MAKFNLKTMFPFFFGVCLTINWLLIWAVPVMGMGLVWKHLLKYFLQPVYDALESNKTLRAFASTYIYSRAEHADYFVMSVLTLLNSVVFLSIVFYWQMKFGYLPAWLLFVYYCSWVGVGGRIMGTAYTMAHKEVSIYAVSIAQLYCVYILLLLVI